MKHVFIINSHTTFLTSVGTVEYLKLNDCDVIFVYVRNYKNSVTKISYKVVDATNISNSCSKISTQYKEYIREVDLFVSQNICDKYALYVPHLWHYFFQILYTHPLCRRVSYVQEGGPVQTKVYDTNVALFEVIKSFVRLAIFRKRTFECKWYRTGIIYKQLTLDSYAVNNVYFHCLPSRNHIVKWPKVQLDLQIKSESPIFIFDGYVKNGLVEPEIYMKLCNELISENSHAHNYVKFHPAQTCDERKAIIGSFKKNHKQVEVMSDDIPMEYIIIQFKNLTFVGFTSSLLYYAHDFGHKVICKETLLLKASNEFRNYLDTCGFQTFAETYSDV